MSRIPERILSETEIAERIGRELPHWRLEGNHLCRTYRVHGWKSVVPVIGAIAHLAEASWHHPDIAASYGSVTVRLTTHSAGGITDKDFQLAAKIEDVIGWRPGREEGSLEGTPAEPRHAYLKYEK